MAALSVEERLEILETRQQELQRVVQKHLSRPADNDKRGWKSIVGTFSDDPLYDEAMELGREWRGSGRPDLGPDAG